MPLQTLDRAVQALHELGHAAPGGVRLADMQRALGLAKPTVHRLMTALVQHGLASQEPTTRRYGLGRSLHALAQLTHSFSGDIPHVCRPVVRRLAARSGHASVLLLKFGLETVVVDQIGGTTAAQQAAHVGLLRPLGAGAAGVSILGAMNDKEVAQVLRCVVDRIPPASAGTKRDLDAEVAMARRNGCAITTDTLVTGMCGIGISLRDPNGVPIGALGLLVPHAESQGGKTHRLIDELVREREKAEDAIRAQSQPFGRPAGIGAKAG